MNGEEVELLDNEAMLNGSRFYTKALDATSIPTIEEETKIIVENDDSIHCGHQLQKEGYNPMAVSKKRQLYFQELADAVDHTLGPFYQRSPLVPKSLYEEWLKAINRPKNQPSTQTPETCGYPHPVIWNGSLEDGNEIVVVTTRSAQFGTLPETLDKLSEKRPGSCRQLDNGWLISKFDLVASVISLELEADKTRKKGARAIEHLPIPGLSDYWDCLPARNDHVES